MRNISIANFCTFLVFFLSISTRTFGADVEIRLTIEPVTPLSRSVVMRVVAVNTSNRAVAVLTWNTPLEGLRGRILSVARNGELLPYIGVIAKRGNPTIDSYLMLAADKSSAPVLIDLSQSYDLTTPGDYEVKFETQSLVPAREVEINEKTMSLRVTNKSSQIAVEVVQPGGFSIPKKSSVDRPAWYEQPDTEVLAFGYVNCDATKETNLNSLHALAKNSADKGKTYMETHSASSPGTPYKTWFGSANQTRFDRVKECFQDLAGDLENKDEIYNCDGSTGDCTPGTYAWVTAGDSSHNVHVCSDYWSGLPDSEFGTRYGTIVHEVSHFNDVCGMGVDLAYGKTKAKNLAKGKPNKAVENADNYQYFSE